MENDKKIFDEIYLQYTDIYGEPGDEVTWCEHSQSGWDAKYILAPGEKERIKKFNEEHLKELANNSGEP